MHKVSLFVVIFVRLLSLYVEANEAKRKDVLGVLPACFQFLRK